ncbi:hypothetical protein H072_7643 [Dactylellina haptotyla CBS 200.50]|uniref:Beta-glucuronidase C-terminal domain-containing protein n=1 Tax=Dactylellina haptotyla (strain CBS 200.50) TaxID=1284197 RepID=S8BTQ6_DACHA|nr:hypothetical protein H072_7643 [Dactylellina haptotyla CBS 200.50]
MPSAWWLGSTRRSVNPAPRPRRSLSLLLFALYFPIIVSAIERTIAISITVPATDNPLRPLDRNLVSWSIQNRDLPIFSRTSYLQNFFNALSTNTAKGQSVRLGGGESDKTTYSPDITITAQKFQSGYYGAQAQGNVTLGPNYFESFKDRYAPNTTYIWCLNLINSTNNFEAAISTAAGVLEYIKDELELFEIGNEADFYGSKGYRDKNWDATMMLPEWNYIADEVQKLGPNNGDDIKFAAGGFANPAYVVTKDFDIPGIIKAGFQSPRIPWYTMHLYPQSGCSGSVTIQPLLSHASLYELLSNYISQVEAAESVGGQFAIGETNTVSCTGRAGISDTFAAALWLVNYVLLSASIGIRRVYFHATSQAPYSPLIPINYSTDSGNYTSGVLPLAYGAYFVSEVLSSNENLHVTEMANDTDYSSYTIWDESNNLKKFVFINLAAYNTTMGVTNSATEDSPAFPFDYPRSSALVNISTPWNAGEELSIIRLQGPGSNAKALVNVSDFTFSTKDAKVENNLVDTILTVQADGYVVFDILASEAVLIQPYSDVLANPHPTKTESRASNSTANGVVMRTRGASNLASLCTPSWSVLVVFSVISAMLAV